MSEKTFKLVTAIVGGVETIAIGVVTYLAPEGATAINASIVIAGTAIIEICNQGRVPARALRSRTSSPWRYARQKVKPNKN